MTTYNFHIKAPRSFREACRHEQPCRLAEGPLYRYIDIYIYIYIIQRERERERCMSKSKGVTYTGYNITSSAEKGDEGEEGKSYFFHHTTRSLCASVGATLSQGPTGGYTCSHRFWSVLCGPKLAPFWDNPKRAGEIPLVGLLS